MKSTILIVLLSFGLMACSSVSGDSSVAENNVEASATPTPSGTKIMQTAIVPIVEMNIGGLLGGSKAGKWISAKDVASQIKGGEKYKLFGSRDAKIKEVAGGAPINEVPCESFYDVQLDESARSKGGVAFGSQLSWNPVPHPIAELSANSSVYKPIITEILASKGLPKSTPKATKILQTDLDGDGKNEVIISATSFKKGVTPMGDIGDYSFILLRKVTNGKAENFILSGDFVKKSENAGAPAEYEISSISDLNGDGKMEIVVFAHYYEGSWVEVYELNNKGATSVEQLKANCGV